MSTIRRITRPVGRSATVRGLVHRLTRDHGIRCVLYHEIAEQPSVYTEGLHVTTPPDLLRSHIDMLAQDYSFVSIDWVLGGGSRTIDGRPPVLVTFDDAYESVTGIAADICEEAGIPSVFFVNGGFVDNATLALDNLAIWVVNSVGMAPLAAAANRPFRDVAEFFGDYLASVTLEERRRVFDALAQELPSEPGEAAAAASLYTTSSALAEVQPKGMLLGNHTWSHVHCRHLDQRSAESEIGANQRFLESIVEYPVTSFSYPYGSRIDAAGGGELAVASFGHQAAFLVESEANRVGADMMRLSRVSAGSVPASDLFAELEILPILRTVRNRGRQHRTASAER